MASFYDGTAGAAILREGPPADRLAGMAMVIGVVPVGVFSRTYDLVVDGAPGGRIEHRILSTRDEASIGTPGGTFIARRQRAFRSRAVLESAAGDARATADRESVRRESYRVAFGDRILYLRQKPFSFSGLFAITDDTGEVGSIRLERPFSRRLAVEFAVAAPPIEITAFLAWIVLMVHRRQSSE